MWSKLALSVVTRRIENYKLARGAFRRVKYICEISPLQYRSRSFQKYYSPPAFLISFSASCEFDFCDPIRANLHYLRQKHSTRTSNDDITLSSYPCRVVKVARDFRPYESHNAR